MLPEFGTAQEKGTGDLICFADLHVGRREGMGSFGELTWGMGSRKCFGGEGGKKRQNGELHFYWVV